MERNRTTGARGEARLNVTGEEYPILFTNRALAQAERVLGKPMLQLLAALQGNSMGIAEMAQLLAVGMEFGRRDARVGQRAYTLEDAWQVMDGLGFTAVTSAVVGAIADVLSYSPPQEGSEVPPA